MTEENAHIVFDQVQKSYDGKTLIVEGLSLSIAKGEFLTLLGPSGSGKTTSLMMLAGFETLTSGEIYINNQPISSIPPHKRGIGMVFQNYALFPHMTVQENLAFPLEVRKLSPDEITRKVARTLDMVRLSGFENRRPAQLSGGQQQRVAVARALVFDPSLVLMDEPLGALDKNLREQMQFELKHIHEELGVTVVYVTHDQGEALTMSNRIAVFNEGVIQQLAAPNTLYEKPENAFVAQFIGENNRFVGTVEAGLDNELCRVRIGGGQADVTALRVRAENNEATILSLRPERVQIGKPEATVENHFDGVIRELIYMGDHIRVRLSLLGVEDFIVKVPNKSHHTDMQVGKTVPLSWAATDCRALDCPAN
ncbi:ABC transporter ATP-binding protein [Candidatus Persebacteraceae bacterium Df01]|jgi:putative spermidine/putrescine transport system ATP-binding protein|uniref:Spermidine/putrescine import ATP-binding protein PotA n=1 Tax=Candidatus Doriopsillibacter californiensis TaxID=2970740 RepID=A0ABT7QJK0_9GAMM|nr:ABC transporter ATP-binding protein [Candidatus Persebacteraceae bacterium Df01]